MRAYHKDCNGGLYVAIHQHNTELRCNSLNVHDMHQLIIVFSHFEIDKIASFVIPLLNLQKS